MDGSKNLDEEESRGASRARWEREGEGERRAGGFESGVENGRVRRMNRGDKNASRGRRVAAWAVCLSISVGPASVR